MPFPDFEEFIAALNEHRVKYLIVGAHAVAYHARPRATKDLDILIQATATNAQRVLEALRDFLGADTGYTVDDLLDSRSIIQLGVAPVRIDILSGIPGCSSFEAAWKGRIKAQFGPHPAGYLALDDLIKAKEAAGRALDLADVRVLKTAREKQKKTLKRKKK